MGKAIRRASRQAQPKVKLAAAAAPLEQVVQHVHQEQPIAPYVELTRGQKGAVGWTVRAQTVEEAARRDRELLELYPRREDGGQ